MKIWKYAMTGVLFFVVLFLGGGQEVQAVGISPVIYDDIELAPGQTITKEMRVFNETTIRDNFYLYPKNFVAMGEEGYAEFRDENLGLQTWFVYPKEKITLDPGDEYRFNVTINVPENAEPGGHYAGMFVTKTPPSEGESDSGVGIGSEVGLLFLVRVAGDVEENSTIKEFDIIKEKSRSNRIPVTFFMRIENNGSVHFKPKGSVVIKNIFGMKKAEIPANPIGGNVLPRSIRRLETAWNEDGMTIAPGSFWEELVYEFKYFSFGRYKAELNLKWSVDKEPLTAATTFWMFPWRALIVIVLALIILVLLVKGYNKIVVRSAAKKKK